MIRDVIGTTISTSKGPFVRCRRRCTQVPQRFRRSQGRVVSFPVKLTRGPSPLSELTPLPQLRLGRSPRYRESVPIQPLVSPFLPCCLEEAERVSLLGVVILIPMEGWISPLLQTFLTPSPKSVGPFCFVLFCFDNITKILRDLLFLLRRSRYACRLSK